MTRFAHIPLAMLAAAMLLLGMSGPAHAQDAAYLWRGFQHVWDYNHRINRLGDFLSMSCDALGCSGTATHTADTGTGPDDASYYSNFTELQSNYAAFQPGYRIIRISTTEGNFLNGTLSVSVPARSNMQNRGRYVVLLNGFDLDAVGEAKKLDHFRIKLSSLTYVNGNLEFDIDWGLKVDCDSVECTGSSAVDYDLTVKFLMIAGDSAEFRYKNADLQNTYSWDTNNEIFYSDEEMVRAIVGNIRHPSEPEYAAGTVGLRGFRINLDDDHHTLALAVRLRDISYNPSGDGRVDFTADVFFKNWADGMVWTHSPASNFAYREAGSTTNMEAYVTMLQFKTAHVVHRFVHDTVWNPNTEVDTAIGF